MKIFVDSSAIKDSTIEITNPVDIKHISKVLRAKIGDEYSVSDGMKWEYKAEIIAIEQDLIEMRILDKQGLTKLMKTDICLFQGVPKAGKMELIVQKAVELGVNEIVPTFMERSVVVDNGKYKNKVERYQKIADEAAKQCRRSSLPSVSNAIKLDEILKRMDEFDLVLLPYENATGETIKGALRASAEAKHIAVVIGPEGGFSVKEVSLLESAGAKCVSLGKNILRTETAGLAAVSMIVYELEL